MTHRVAVPQFVQTMPTKPEHVVQMLKDMGNFPVNGHSWIDQMRALAEVAEIIGFHKAADKIPDILEEMRKNQKLAASLDAIADDLEKIDPRLALAVDQVSDRLEK